MRKHILSTIRAKEVQKEGKFTYEILYSMLRIVVGACSEWEVAKTRAQ